MRSTWNILSSTGMNPNLSHYMNKKVWLFRLECHQSALIWYMSKIQDNFPGAHLTDINWRLSSMRQEGKTMK